MGDVSVNRGVETRVSIRGGAGCCSSAKVVKPMWSSQFVDLATWPDLS
jgi:hypothetical protein